VSDRHDVPVHAAAADPSFLSTVPGWAFVSAVLVALIAAVLTPWMSGRQQRTLRDRIAKDIEAWEKLPPRTEPAPPWAPGADGPKEKLWLHIEYQVDELTTSRRGRYEEEFWGGGIMLFVAGVAWTSLQVFSGMSGFEMREIYSTNPLGQFSEGVWHGLFVVVFDLATLAMVIGLGYLVKGGVMALLTPKFK